MFDFSREEIIKRLLELDNDAFLLLEDINGKFDVYIVGGGALILQNFIPRSTHDIDTINVKNHSLISLMNKYDINVNSNAYLDCFTADYQSRAQKLDLDTRVIDFYTLSLEDLVISKIAAAREKDIEDICSRTVLESLNWNLLELLANEVKDSMISERQISEFNHYYKLYIEEYRK